MALNVALELTKENWWQEIEASMLPDIAKSLLKSAVGAALDYTIPPMVTKELFYLISQDIRVITFDKKRLELILQPMKNPDSFRLRVRYCQEDRPDHPEQRAEECLYGNLLKDEFKALGFQTKRMGKEAFSALGKKINQGDNGPFPVFVLRDELSARNIMPDSLF